MSSLSSSPLSLSLSLFLPSLSQTHSTTLSNPIPSFKHLSSITPLPPPSRPRRASCCVGEVWHRKRGREGKKVERSGCAEQGCKKDQMREANHRNPPRPSTPGSALSASRPSLPAQPSPSTLCRPRPPRVPPHPPLPPHPPCCPPPCRPQPLHARRGLLPRPPLDQPYRTSNKGARSIPPRPLPRLSPRAEEYQL